MVLRSEHMDLEIIPGEEYLEDMVLPGSFLLSSLDQGKDPFGKEPFIHLYYYLNWRTHHIL